MELGVKTVFECIKLTMEKTHATKQIKTLFSQARKALVVNRDQSEAKVIFDILDGINRASLMLNSAWKLSEHYKINDDSMRKEFINMFSYFGRVKKQLKEEFKYKH
jgi:hypothetical protein